MKSTVSKYLSAAALMFFLFCYNNSYYAQQKSENMPLPVGGVESIMQNVIYPETAKNAGIQGKVIVTALVNLQGDVIKTTVVRSAGPELDKAAQEAIEKTKFVPAIKNGEKVQAEVTIPVYFKLNEEKKNKE
ncbi:MAG: hypothetical protein CVV23_12205 [Ignavibacteriae bacterium HGW-Ignavibacteriae-2]|jgi:protein TonB|nr:MAG: hypothetical protein CVV23_12205 [Ignavibacteriae bacterium HGW-Ignavibacteriae-2]